MLSACADSSALAADAVQGKIESLPEGWSGRAVYVYAAQYSGDPQGAGYYVLEPDVHPRAEVMGDGRFQITDLPPGAYILLAGPEPEEAVRLMDEAGALVVIQLEGEGLDLGKVFLIQ